MTVAEVGAAQMSTFPPPPAALDWEELGVVARPVNGHVECRWSSEKGEWDDPIFVEDPCIKVDGLSPALNYGQQAYEGMKALRGHDGAIRVIHINKHASRFATSCEAVSLPTLPPALFKRAILQAVAANAEYVPPYGSSAALYVRPVTYGTSATLNVLPADEALFCVFVSPINSLHGHEPLDALILEDFDRAAPRGTGGAKIGGNYAPMFRWVRQAKKQGFGITLHLDSLTRTHIDEFSTCGFIGVRRCPGGAFHLVVPVSESAMKSVTSEMCVEIAERRGWSVARRPIPYTELPAFDEVLAVGTAAVILPIGSITRHSVHEKTTYSSYTQDTAFAALLSDLQAIQRGLRTDFDWATLVQPQSQGRIQTA